MQQQINIVWFLFYIQRLILRINNFKFTFLLITESQNLLFWCLFLMSAFWEVLDVSFCFGQDDVNQLRCSETNAPTKHWATEKTPIWKIRIFWNELTEKKLYFQRFLFSIFVRIWFPVFAFFWLIKLWRK